MNYSFHPADEQELVEAVDYYETCQSGLGVEFSREIYRSIQNILLYPDAWAPLSTNTRRCLANRFPYGIIYQTIDDEIIIIAVMQLNRKPGYWKGRE